MQCVILRTSNDTNNCIQFHKGLKMSMRSTKARYGAVAITIHWLTAILILVMLGTGFRGADMVDPAAKIAILRIHAIIGITVLVLTIARIIWWLTIDKKPPAVAGESPLLNKAASAVHGLLYLLVFVVVGSGMAMMILSGAGEILFGGAARALPDFFLYPPRIPHEIAALALLALFVAHALAALYHQFIRKDRLLGRMGIGAQ